MPFGHSRNHACIAAHALLDIYPDGAQNELASVRQRVDEIVRFYANFHSIRSIGDDLVVRMHRGPDDHQLADLNERFDHLVKSGSIRRTDPYGVEKRQDDHVELDRIAFEFDRHGYAELRGLIDALNHF